MQAASQLLNLRIRQSQTYGKEQIFITTYDQREIFSFKIFHHSPFTTCAHVPTHYSLTSLANTLCEGGPSISVHWSKFNIALQDVNLPGISATGRNSREKMFLCQKTGIFIVNYVPKEEKASNQFWRHKTFQSESGVFGDLLNVASTPIPLQSNLCSVWGRCHRSVAQHMQKVPHSITRTFCWKFQDSRQGTGLHTVGMQ